MNTKLMYILSMLVFGTIGLFVRGIGLPSQELALCRALLALVFIGGFMLVSRRRIKFGKIKKELGLLLVSGGALGLNWVLLFEAYKYTTVSAATLSYYFAPVIVTLASPLLFREKLGLRQWLCFIMTTLGIVLVTLGGDNSAVAVGSNHILGILFGLGAACFYAAVMLLNKFIKKVEGIDRTFLQFIAAAAVLLPYVLFSGGFTLGTLDAVGWVFLIIVGVVHSGVNYCLYFSSLKELPGQQAAVLSYIDPLTAVLVSVLILGETMSPIQTVGGLLILGFTLLNEIPIKKRRDDA